MISVSFSGFGRAWGVVRIASSASVAPLQYKSLPLGGLQALILSLCFLFVSACGAVMLKPSDAEVRGSRPLTGSEYNERYAGNSFKFARNEGQISEIINREIYFGKNGSFSVVDLDRELILHGNWSVNTATGGNLVINYTVAGLENGKPYRSSPAFMTIYTYVLPDGTASVFSRSPEGPSISREPKPTPGFQARSRFNSIKGKVDAALGS